MSHSVLQSAAARRDILERFHYYAGVSTALLLEFDAALRNVFETRSRSPQIYGVLDHGIRAVTVGKFQDVVYYSVEPDEVLVIAVLHGHRYPDAWTGRVR